jgi:hypothetical protein
MAQSKVEKRVEIRVDQAKKYVERSKGWRPQPRTIAYLTVMLAALVLSAFIVPHILPGKLQNAETLVGRSGGISVVPLGGGATHELITRPAPDEGYTSWAISESREEVAVGWFHKTGGKVDKVTVQSRSAYSGRLQAEWVVPGEKPQKIDEIGFVRQHNQIWFISGGRMWLVDIKSGAVIEFPFKGPEGTGEVKMPSAVSYATFSPKDGRLAYAENGRINVVTGLATGRGDKKITQRAVLEAGFTRDSQGRVIKGKIDSFTWLSEESIAVLITERTGAKTVTAIYLVKLSASGASSVDPLMAPTEDTWFTSISTSPKSGEFAVLVKSGGPGADSLSHASVKRYDPAGVLKGTVDLTAGDWRAPISWTSP